MMDETVWGYFVDNIKKWIIDECLQSGDADNFFRATRDVIEMMETDIDNNPKYWDELYELSSHLEQD